MDPVTMGATESFCVELLARKFDSRLLKMFHSPPVETTGQGKSTPSRYQ